MAKATAETVSTTTETLLENARTVFSNLRPSVTTNEFGAPVLTFEAEARSGTDPKLKGVLAAPAKAAETTGRCVAVAFEEFQEISTYDTDRLVRPLCFEIQHRDEGAALFLGSRRHRIRERRKGFATRMP